jgi:predicted phage tail protein
MTYTYRVKAVNAGGDSLYSNLATATIPGPPAAPSNLTGTAAKQGKNARVTLKWLDNANNESGFTVQMATNLNFTTGVTNTNVAANTTTYTTGNISSGRTYYFRVRAYNGVGNSAWSNILIITTP